MNYDIEHCFDFKDDVCPEDCRLAKEEREMDSGAADCSPRFLSYAHLKGTKECHLEIKENDIHERRGEGSSDEAGT